MSLFRRWLGRDKGPSPPPPSDALEPFDYPVRIVHVPERSAALVWKTHTAGATEVDILLLPPNTEWESTLPLDRPVTVVLTASGRLAEIEGTLRVERRNTAVFLALPRPAELQWQTSEVGAQQSRKYLRVDVSLPARVSTVLPSSPGVRPRTSEPRTARVQDLSLEGMSLRIDFQPAPGDRLEVVISSPGLNVQVQSRVVRVKPGDGELPFVAALAFDHLSAVNRELIGSYVLSRQRK